MAPKREWIQSTYAMVLRREFEVSNQMLIDTLKFLPEWTHFDFTELYKAVLYLPHQQVASKHKEAVIERVNYMMYQFESIPFDCKSNLPLTLVFSKRRNKWKTSR